MFATFFPLRAIRRKCRSELYPEDSSYGNHLMFKQQINHARVLYKSSTGGKKREPRSELTSCFASTAYINRNCSSSRTVRTTKHNIDQLQTSQKTRASSPASKTEW